MISLAGIVKIVLFLLVAAAVIGLLWLLIGIWEKCVGGPPIVYNVARLVLLTLVILLMIYFLLSFASGQPVFVV